MASDKPLVFDETHVWTDDPDLSPLAGARLTTLTTAGRKRVICMRAAFIEEWCLEHDSRYIIGQSACLAQQGDA